MDSMEEQYGYDGDFIGDVPEFLKCVVCHLVMRQPVQVMICGHRFCKPCFNRIESYSKHLNTIFCCPIDRETIDLSKVFDDTACSRDIGNLNVACSYSSMGCLWVGDLRSLLGHEKDCQYSPKVTLSNQISEFKEEGALLKEILHRLCNCENTLSEKEKDLAHVKFDIREMKNNAGKKDEELSAFKTLCVVLQTEMEQVKKSNEELEMKYEEEIKSLKEQNKTLQEKVESLDAKLVESNNALKDDEVLRRKIESMNINSNKNLTSCQKEIANMKSQIKSSIPLKADFIKLDGEVTKMCKEIRSLRSHNDKTLNKKKNEIIELTNRVEVAEELIQGVTAELENLTEKLLSTKNDDIMELTNGLEVTENLDGKEIGKDLSSHIANIENILFCDMSDTDKEIRYKWVLTDLKYHWDKKDPVSSPLFYPQLGGYCFQLEINWNLVPNYFCVALLFYRGRSAHEDLKPCGFEYTLELLHKTGRNEILKDVCRRYYSVQSNSQYSNVGTLYISYSSLRDYVINDKMFISSSVKFM